MAWFKSEGIGIAGMTTAVPKHLVTADDFRRRFGGEVIDKFVKSTGIASAHHSIPEQTASDLGFEAADYLLKELCIDRSEVGVLVFVSNTADYMFPATAGVLQMRLGLPWDTAAFDIRLGCTGFVYGQQVVKSMMMASDVKYGLFIGGDTTSKVIGKNDHSAMMFGDAASAVLFERREGERHQTLLKTDGSRFGSLIYPGGGFRDLYASHEEVLCSDGVVRTKFEQYMDGMGIMVFAIGDALNAVDEYTKTTDKPANCYDQVVLHQANGFILQRLIKKLKLDQEKVPISLNRYGNTSGISVVLTICDQYGDVDDGVKSLLISGFGVGLSWGVTSFDIDTACIFPIIQTDSYFTEGRIELSNL